MERTTFPVGTFEVNCSIVFEGGKALVVDPGAEATLVAAKLAKLGLEPAAVLLTHAHFDHVGAVPDLQRSFQSLPVFVSGADLILVMDHGKIVERGTHDELYAANGVYRKLCDMQHQS